MSFTKHLFKAIP